MSHGYSAGIHKLRADANYFQPCIVSVSVSRPRLVESNVQGEDQAFVRWRLNVAGPSSAGWAGTTATPLEGAQQRGQAGLASLGHLRTGTRNTNTQTYHINTKVEITILANITSVTYNKMSP